MEIVISNSSDQPIYEQIASQIRTQVLGGTLSEGDRLPSIRALATQLRISAITTKRAYQDLETQGFIHTVPGKGCFVAGDNLELLREERLRMVEASLAKAVADARTAGITADELREMLEEGVRQEIAWGQYVIGENIPGLTGQQVSDYIHYLGNLRWSSLGMGQLYPEFAEEPADMAWVSQYSNANMVKTDFFEARSTAYAKSTALVDDL